MEFQQWLNESTLNELVQSAIDAFPNTTKRQHVVNEVEIQNLALTPYLGVRTLFVRATAINEDRQYRPMILFRNVNYRPQGEGRLVQIERHGRQYFLEQLLADEHDVLTRCNCPDFYWRFHHYNSLDHSLYGRNRNPYDGQPPPANPQEMPGMCKHLMALKQNLEETGLVQP